MKVYWLDTGDSADDVFYLRKIENIEIATNPDLAAVAKNGGYISEDEISLNPDTPGLQNAKTLFAREHKHSADEVRYIIEGSGIFDVRSKDDEWIRIEVEQGDLIIIPAGRYHRFFLTDENRIRAKRMFKDHSGWAAEFREES